MVSVFLCPFSVLASEIHILQSKNDDKTSYRALLRQHMGSCNWIRELKCNQCQGILVCGFLMSQDTFIYKISGGFVKYSQRYLWFSKKFKTLDQSYDVTNTYQRSLEMWTIYRAMDEQFVLPRYDLYSWLELWPNLETKWKGFGDIST